MTKQKIKLLHETALKIQDRHKEYFESRPPQYPDMGEVHDLIKYYYIPIPNENTGTVLLSISALLPEEIRKDMEQTILPLLV